MNMSPGEATTIRTFIAACVAQGLEFRGVGDGEEFHKAEPGLSLRAVLAQAIKVCDSVEESTLRFRDSNGNRYSAYVVLGNAADGSEVIADHSDCAEMNAIWNTVRGGLD